MTIHQQALSYLKIYSRRWENWRENHPNCPEFIALKCIAGIRRSAIRRSAKDAVTPPPHAATHITRDTVQRLADYRGEMAATCAGLRRVTGMTGGALRELGRQVRNKRFSWGVNWEIFAAVPDAAIGGMVGDIRRDGVYIERGHKWSAEWAAGFHANHGVEALICMALTEAVRMDIGEREAKQILARLADPAAKISGYLADTIHAYMQHGAESSQGYERCSGCESYTWFRAHPETWSTLLAHAPVGQVTETAIQCYPHPREKEEACTRAKLFKTFRLNDSIYSGTPEQIANVLAEIKG